VALPAMISRAGHQAAWRFLEFFTVHIRNPHTRAAYGRAAARVPTIVREPRHRGTGARCSRCMWRPTSSSCKPVIRRPRSSSILPARACCSTGWSPARLFPPISRTPSVCFARVDGFSCTVWMARFLYFLNTRTALPVLTPCLSGKSMISRIRIILLQCIGDPLPALWPDSVHALCP
jgi:hypothetical protein